MATMEVDTQFIRDLIDLSHEFRDKYKKALDIAQKRHKKDQADHRKGKCTTMQLVETQRCITTAKAYNDAVDRLCEILMKELKKHPIDEEVPLE